MSTLTLFCVEFITSWSQILHLSLESSRGTGVGTGQGIDLTSGRNAGADPGFDQGGAQIMTGLNCQQ